MAHRRPPGDWQEAAVPLDAIVCDSRRASATRRPQHRESRAIFTLLVPDLEAGNISAKTAELPGNPSPAEQSRDERSRAFQGPAKKGDACPMRISSPSTATRP